MAGAGGSALNPDDQQSKGVRTALDDDVRSEIAIRCFRAATALGLRTVAGVPDPAFVRRLREMLGADLHELSGTAISGEIPLRDDLVNRLIAQRLAASPSAVSAVRVDAQDDDHVGVEMSMRAGPMMLPAVRIAALIDRQPDFPHSPILGLRWSLPAMGPLGLFAAPVLNWLKALPPGIHADGDRIGVDIGAVLRSQGLAELLPSVAAFQIHTRRGAFVIRFELRVS